jgi:hypothetical protein
MGALNANVNEMNRKSLILCVVAALIVAAVLCFRWERAYSMNKLLPINWNEKDITGHKLVLDNWFIEGNYSFGSNGICDVARGMKWGSSMGLVCYWKIEHEKLKLFDKTPDGFSFELTLLKRETNKVIVREGTGDIRTYLVDPPSK